MEKFPFPFRSSKSKKETFGFKTTSAPPNNPELKQYLKQFESELYDIVNNVKFKKYKPNHVQKKMKDDLKKMKDDSRVYVAADKTSDFYRMPSEDYKELLEKNIKKSRKK